MGLLKKMESILSLSTANLMLKLKSFSLLKLKKKMCYKS